MDCLGKFGGDARVSIVGLDEGRLPSLHLLLASIAAEGVWIDGRRSPSFNGLTGFFDEMRAGGGFVLVAVNGSDVVGWTDVVVSAGVGVLGIGLAKEFRGAGLGFRLMGSVIDVATKAGLSHLRLDVSPSNARALRLYARCGFVEETSVDNESALANGAVTMVLRLTPSF